MDLLDNLGLGGGMSAPAPNAGGGGSMSMLDDFGLGFGGTPPATNGEGQ